MFINCCYVDNFVLINIKIKNLRIQLFCISAERLISTRLLLPGLFSINVKKTGDVSVSIRIGSYYFWFANETRKYFNLVGVWSTDENEQKNNNYELHFDNRIVCSSLSYDEASELIIIK